MRAHRRHVGTPGPKAIGIEAIAIPKGHTYRIVVSDLERRRPIYFGAKDRSGGSMDEFLRLLLENKARRIRLAVMNIWAPFRTSTTQDALRPRLPSAYFPVSLLTRAR